MSARDSDANLFVPLYDDDEASVRSSHLNLKMAAATDNNEIPGLKLEWRSMQVPSAEPNIIKDRDLDSEYGEEGMEHLYYGDNNNDEASSDIYDEPAYSHKEFAIPSTSSWNVFTRSSRVKPADIELGSVTGSDVAIDSGRRGGKRVESMDGDKNQGVNWDIYSSYSEFKDAFKNALEAETIRSTIRQPDRHFFSNRGKSPDISSFVEERSKILGEDGFIVLGFEDPDDNCQPDGKWLDGSTDLNPTRVRCEL